jgi:hypothetical protein
LSDLLQHFSSAGLALKESGITNYFKAALPSHDLVIVNEKIIWDILKREQGGPDLVQCP